MSEAQQESEKKEVIDATFEEKMTPEKLAEFGEKVSKRINKLRADVASLDFSQEPPAVQALRGMFLKLIDINLGKEVD